METLIVRNVDKVYPGSRGEPDVEALKNVTFEAYENEFCCILGHSGCGKSTLLNMIAGFEQPTAGTLLVDGEPVGRPTWHRTVVFQDYALFPWLTVSQNIAFGLEQKKIPPAERQQIIDHYMNLVGLSGFGRRFPHELSGGMKQRVAIARALAVQPRILLMDEPFAALDAQTRSYMQVELIKIWKKERKTVVFVTHSIEEAVQLADRIIVMTRRPGRVKANLKVDLPRPRSEEDPEVRSLHKQIHTLIQEE